MPYGKRIYFVDFDGTITVEDTCYKMTTAFAGEGWQELDDKWQRGEIGTEECSAGLLNLFQATAADWRKLMSGIEIDAAFQEFVKYCKSREEELYILSDGFDLNIAAILKRYGLGDLPFYANGLIIEDGKFSMSCPYQNPQCLKCGTCKSTLLKNLNPEQRTTVYIGDGTSDLCVAGKADILFAKGRLLEYSQEQDLKAIPYQTFADVLSTLEG